MKCLITDQLYFMNTATMGGFLLRLIGCQLSIHLHSRVAGFQLTCRVLMNSIAAVDKLSPKNAEPPALLRIVGGFSSQLWSTGGNLNIFLTSCNRLVIGSYLNNSLRLSSHRLRSSSYYIFILYLFTVLLSSTFLYCFLLVD